MKVIDVCDRRFQKHVKLIMILGACSSISIFLIINKKEFLLLLLTSNLSLIWAITYVLYNQVVASKRGSVLLYGLSKKEWKNISVKTRNPFEALSVPFETIKDRSNG